jgi:hypothetical protein
MYEEDVAEAPATASAPVEKESGYEVPAPRKDLVKDWMERVEKGRRHHEKAFKQMRTNMQLAKDGASTEWIDAKKFVVPILVRYINQAVSQLYAKNPVAVAKRKKRMLYTLWDGRSDSLMAAMQSAEGAMMGMAPLDPNAIALIQEVQAGVQQKQMYDRMAETLELLYGHYVNEQAYNYKQQIKAAVRRTKVCGVSYLKLGFQRIMEQSPEAMARIEDITAKINETQCILEKMSKNEIGEEDAALEQLKLSLADLQASPDLVVREGPIFTFPRATSIIIDPKCFHLKSFAGAGWVAEEYEMSPEEIKGVYNVDIGKEFKEYKEKEDAQGDMFDKDKQPAAARVYEIWDKKRQQVLTTKTFSRRRM